MIQIETAKARLRQSARDRDAGQARMQDVGCAIQGVVGFATRNPLTTAAVGFALLSLLGPARVIRLAMRGAGMMGLATSAVRMLRNIAATPDLDPGAPVHDEEPAAARANGRR